MINCTVNMASLDFVSSRSPVRVHLPSYGCTFSHSTGSSLVLDEDWLCHLEPLIFASKFVDSGRHAVDFPAQFTCEFPVRECHAGVVNEGSEDFSLFVADVG